MLHLSLTHALKDHPNDLLKLRKRHSGHLERLAVELHPNVLFQQQQVLRCMRWCGSSAPKVNHKREICHAQRKKEGPRRRKRCGVVFRGNFHSIELHVQLTLTGQAIQKRPPLCWAEMSLLLCSGTDCDCVGPWTRQHERAPLDVIVRFEKIWVFIEHFREPQMLCVGDLSPEKMGK